jgi:Kef-type K+ transport system membrane component KefB
LLGLFFISVGMSLNLACSTPIFCGWQRA